VDLLRAERVGRSQHRRDVVRVVEPIEHRYDRARALRKHGIDPREPLLGQQGLERADDLAR
jgi:hypothetical protein